MRVGWGKGVAGRKPGCYNLEEIDVRVAIGVKELELEEKRRVGEGVKHGENRECLRGKR